MSGCIDMAAKAQSLGWGVVASIESPAEHAETADDFVAHLAVGVKVGQFRAGGLRSAEHITKYNALLRLSSDEDAALPYAGGGFRMAR